MTTNDTMRTSVAPIHRMVTTQAGITIGIAHQRKPQPLGSHAEKIQAALLEKPAPKGYGPVWWACIVALSLLAAFVIAKGT